MPDVPSNSNPTPVSTPGPALTQHAEGANAAPANVITTESMAPLAPYGGEDQPSDSAQVALRMLPWAISIVAHAVFILFALFVVFIVARPAPEEKIVIPAIRLSDNPGAALEAQELEPMETAAEVTVPTPKTDTVVNPDPVEVETEAFALSGVGGATSNPFGDLELTGELSVGFMGSGGNAKSIVFVIDASGSLVAAYPDIIKELKRSIQQLSPQQTFHVIFFTGLQNRPVYAMKKSKGMFRGTADEKASVAAWVDVDAHNVEPGSQGDPVAAIKAALKLDPELVYLLSDNITGQGKYEIDRADLIRQIRLANRKSTVINTIQFFYPDTLDPDDQTKWTLFRIAQMTGGKFKYVDAAELYGS